MRFSRTGFSFLRPNKQSFILALITWNGSMKSIITEITHMCKLMRPKILLTNPQPWYHSFNAKPQLNSIVIADTRSDALLITIPYPDSSCCQTKRQIPWYSSQPILNISHPRTHHHHPSRTSPIPKQATASVGLGSITAIAAISSSSLASPNIEVLVELDGITVEVEVRRWCCRWRSMLLMLWML